MTTISPTTGQISPATSGNGWHSATSPIQIAVQNPCGWPGW
jgi:hypothetical protein